jgi:hypothetical protein
VTGNTAAGVQSAILSQGVLTIDNSTVSNNTTVSSALSVGFAGSGSTTIRNSRITGNTASAAAPLSSRAALTMDRSLFANNSGLLAGLDNSQGGQATVTNSTFANNTGTGGLAAISTNSGSVTNLSNVTIAGNSGGIEAFNTAPVGATNIRNTIIAGSTGPNCLSTLPVSQGNNLSSDGTCNLNAAGDKPSTPPGFATGALGNNGGPTQTIALAPTSAAVDAGSNAATTCAAGSTDQRGTGFPRVLDGNGDGTAICDIGAYEMAAFVQPMPVPTAVATAVPPTPFVAPPIPQVFQNPGAVAAVGARPASTPTPRVAVATAVVAPSAAIAPVISPPRTGNAGLKNGGD